MLTSAGLPVKGRRVGELFQLQSQRQRYVECERQENPRLEEDEALGALWSLNDEGSKCLHGVCTKPRRQKAQRCRLGFLLEFFGGA